MKGSFTIVALYTTPSLRDAIEIQKTYSLIYTFTKSFKGNLIDLVTNSSFFVETIKSAGIKEPVPWDVFPVVGTRYFR